MKILLLSEGDPAKPIAFSGIGKSIYDHLRQVGNDVIPVDVDVHGLERYLLGGLTWSPQRTRWLARFRVGGLAFQRRSANATRELRRHAAGLDAVLQFGATFAPAANGRTPYFLYCDSNHRMALRSPFAVSSHLPAGESERVTERERRVYAGARGIFTFSEWARRSFIEDFGVPPERVTAVGAGPNFDVSRIPSRNGTRGSRPPTVLFVGGEFERKGGDVLLEAFRLVREEIPNARLVVVGAKDARIDAPGVEPLGFLRKDNPADWQRLVDAYREADVFAFPTRFDAFGIVVLEAMFFGLPCVAVDAWAIPEMVVDGETGYTVPLGNARVLADRLLLVLRDDALARRLGAAGRARAEQRFTWTGVAERMTAAMRAALR
ncbi:MAG TPA: glycosyltransferase family 4 protein [Gemmatimonadaceae bacterium]|nr:glycosyltransferase family 4 protein [Gemmatimonadaceae bacterium]